jgi:amino acid transporter
VLYAFARDRIIPRVFGLIGRAHQTPWAALLILAAIPPILLIPYLASTSANHAIGDIISADGMFGLFMYFVIALASVWFYRAYLRRSVVTFLFMGVLPLLGGLYMGAIFFYGLTTQASVVAWVSVAGVALAFLLGALVVWRAAPTSEFFKGINERRQADRMGEPAAAEEAVSSQPEVS